MENYNDKMKSGISSYLTKEETEVSLSQAIYRWSTRKKNFCKNWKTNLCNGKIWKNIPNNYTHWRSWINFD